MQATFQFIKSTWGISIGIAICDHEMDCFIKGSHSLFAISEKLYLAVDERHISRKGLKYLFSAFYNSRQLLGELTTHPTVFRVEHIDYANTDYQDEGMYCVAINWIRDRYELALEIPSISFDKEKNRYLFDIVHLQEPAAGNAKHGV